MSGLKTSLSWSLRGTQIIAWPEYWGHSVGVAVFLCDPTSLEEEMPNNFAPVIWLPLFKPFSLHTQPLISCMAHPWARNISATNVYNLNPLTSPYKYSIALTEKCLHTTAYHISPAYTITSNTPPLQHTHTHLYVWIYTSTRQVDLIHMAAQQPNGHFNPLNGLANAIKRRAAGDEQWRVARGNDWKKNKLSKGNNIIIHEQAAIYGWACVCAYMYERTRNNGNECNRLLSSVLSKLLVDGHTKARATNPSGIFYIRKRVLVMRHTHEASRDG